MENYLQIRDNLFYKIETGKITAVNISEDEKRRGIKENKSLPSGLIKDVKVITKEEYDKAINILNTK